ncbi:class I SAM-dependent DNA methyltransferase [Streptomyces sp. NPDC001137]|uniref:type I restriction-modification system subunit M n=1 Tax=Streptomyces sp. NPDC001137 TaxID=3154378 RepID=UPI0033238729
MPPRHRKPADQPRQPGGSSPRELQNILWKAADKLRGLIDAAEYKETVLGLIFLKYVSDVIEEHRLALEQRLLAAGIDDDLRRFFVDERASYTNTHAVWVPTTARWAAITRNARPQGLGKQIDDAMDAIMRENASLIGALPKVFNRLGNDEQLADLVDLIGDARFGDAETNRAHDIPADVFEYFLHNFAVLEGRKGGEFYTPSSVTRLVVELLEPYEGRVYDPVCGSGGMLVQASRFVETYRGRDHRADITVHGQEMNERTWRLAKMNLAIHNIDGDLGLCWEDTLAYDVHPDLKADFVLAQPPFNIKNWARNESDPRWTYGVPPRNNANYAWLQHAISKLGERGTAGVLLANGSLFSQSRGEVDIRRALIESDQVACIVALPPQLFRSTSIPACLWVLARNKSSQGSAGLEERRGQILFIDARRLGVMADRTSRVLDTADTASIVDAYRAWRGTASARQSNLSYRDEPGFCLSVDLATVREHGYVLTPGRYVSTGPDEDEDLETGPEKHTALTKDLYGLFD